MHWEILGMKSILVGPLVLSSNPLSQICERYGYCHSFHFHPTRSELRPLLLFVLCALPQVNLASLLCSVNEVRTGWCGGLGPHWKGRRHSSSHTVPHSCLCARLTEDQNSFRGLKCRQIFPIKFTHVPQHISPSSAAVAANVPQRVPRLSRYSVSH